MEGWLSPGGKAFAGEDSCVSEHANLGEKEQVLQKRCDLVDMWDVCGPLKSNAQQREQAKDSSAKIVRSWKRKLSRNVDSTAPCALSCSCQSNNYSPRPLKCRQLPLKCQLLIEFSLLSSLFRLLLPWIHTSSPCPPPSTVKHIASVVVIMSGVWQLPAHLIVHTS